MKHYQLETLFALALACCCACSDAVPPVDASGDLQSDSQFDSSANCPDEDGDGYYVAGPNCPTPAPPLDCDDGDPYASPGLEEVCDDGLDNDCDTIIDEPFLCEGCQGECVLGESRCAGRTEISRCQSQDSCPVFGPNEACPDGSACEDGVCVERCADRDSDGFSADCGDRLDCDDTRSNVYPGAPEICDSLDNNCDRRSDENFICEGECVDGCDGDNVACTSDGLGIVDCQLASNGCWVLMGRVLCPNGGSCGNGRCGVEPTCLDGDGDGYGPNCTNEDDCLPAHAASYPTADEVCDGLDNNCDGTVDENACDSCVPSSETSPRVGLPHYGVACGGTEYVSIGSAQSGDTIAVALSGERVEPFAYGREQSGSFNSIGDSVSSGLGSVAVFQAPSSGDYRMRIAIDVGTSYQVAAVVSDGSGCIDDSREPNDSPAQATPVGQLPFAADGTVCAGDSDYFSFDRPEGSVLTATVAHQGTGSGDVGLTLWRNGGLVSPGFVGSTSEGFATSHYAFVSLDEPGEYSVAVTGIASGGGSYALTIDAIDFPDCSDDTGDLDVGDDVVANASAALTHGSTFTGVLCPGDYDVFELGELSAGDHVDATLSHDLSINLDGRLLRDSWIGLAQEQRNDGATERFNNDISADGTYYLVIYGRTASDSGAYTLRWE